MSTQARSAAQTPSPTGMEGYTIKDIFMLFVGRAIAGAAPIAIGTYMIYLVTLWTTDLTINLIAASLLVQVFLFHVSATVGTRQGGNDWSLWSSIAGILVCAIALTVVLISVYPNVNKEDGVFGNDEHFCCLWEPTMAYTKYNCNMTAAARVEFCKINGKPITSPNDLPKDFRLHATLILLIASLLGHGYIIILSLGLPNQQNGMLNANIRAVNPFKSSRGGFSSANFGRFMGIAPSQPTLLPISTGVATGVQAGVSQPQVRYVQA
jgi:hypothetical protein